MADEYKTLVQKAWKLIGAPVWDGRSFLETVSDLKTANVKLSAENAELHRRLKDLQRYITTGEW